MHRRAMELRRELVKGFPGNGQYHSDLGGSLHYLAYVLGKFGKFEENRGVLKEAIEEQVAALRLAPGLKSAHTYLINHYSYYCSTLLRLNNPDGAADAIEELPRHLPSDSEAQLKAAWVLIGCARMTPVDDERRKKFAARAVGHLEKAVGLGFKDLKRLQKESRFGWLLGRKDYQQLLMRLEEKRDR